ncbi:MAG: response regulator [Bacteroidales bacterium]|nr:response regulator [Bacteroidales bacterium]
MEEFLKGKQILVVEDEEINWFLIRDILEEQMAILTWAEIGQKAVDMIREGQLFDVVLMDINLPAMDGLQVTREILKIHPQIPVIAQTAYALDEEIGKVYEAGCCGHVLKPFTIDELIAVLRKVLTD